jgi:hypothetical protein
MKYTSLSVMVWAHVKLQAPCADHISHDILIIEDNTIRPMGATVNRGQKGWTEIPVCTT